MAEETKTPQCIGIIMDGNRRWAKTRGLPAFEGHRQGYQTMKKVAEWAEHAGVGTLIFYAFSEENWKRTEGEVSYLMGLIRQMLAEEMEEIIKKNIRVRYIGDLSKFSEDIQQGMEEARKKSESNTGVTVVIAASYGGRNEIVRAVNRMIKDGKKEITASDMSAYIDTAGILDPDIVIRTSGEQRLSGFLTWQSIYSELFFTKTMWPDFSEEEFLSILHEYSERDRRMGK